MISPFYVNLTYHGKALISADVPLRNCSVNPFCVADGNRVIEEELVPFATSRKSCDDDDFDDLLQIARERLSQR